jgi:hypothetical protein
MDKINGLDADKSEWINLEIFMDPDNPASKYSRNFFYLQGLIPRELDQVDDGIP